MPDNLFQSEAESAKPLIRKELFCSHANRTHFHKEGFLLSFALKVRVLELGYGLLRLGLGKIAWSRLFKRWIALSSG